MADGDPQRPADRRPGDVPYFIDAECACGEPLVYFEVVDEGIDPDAVVFYDEFTCPDCDNGVHLDWPKDHIETVFDDDQTFTNLDDV